MINTLLNNRYRLDTELGQGGMGVVYRAHDILLEREVAVKVLSKAALGTEGRACLLREARAAAGLNHPSIVAIYDAGQAAVQEPAGEQVLPYIVMELIEGASLDHCRPQGLEAIVSIARQLCAALEHAHGQAIIHRDLKPENVLCAPDGNLKPVQCRAGKKVQTCPAGPRSGPRRTGDYCRRGTRFPQARHQVVSAQ